MTTTTKRRLIWAIPSLLVAFASMEFFRPPLPAAGTGAGPAVWDDPDFDPRVGALLQRACADCHSDHTRWPWYARVNPSAWLVVNDVTRGRRQLNFSRDRTLRGDVLGDIHDALDDRSMPPKSYLMLHPEARLSTEDRALLIQWSLGDLK
jgi:hypothetical protein